MSPKTRNARFSRLAAPLIALGLAASASAQTQPQRLQNGGLEAFETSGQPTGWKMTEGTLAVRDTAAEGKSSARISAKPGAGGPARLTQSIDAARYAGKRIRLAAMARTDSAPDGPAGELWLQAFNAAGQPLIGSEGQLRVVRAPSWARFEILSDIPLGASTVVVGALPAARGNLWIDAVRFEALGPAGLGASPPRALSAAEQMNLTAFARAYGYVRFFYPGDEAAAADWDRLAIDGVDRVLGARGPKALAGALQDVFGPVAPLFRASTAPLPTPPPPEISQGLRWRHTGVQLQARPFRSERVTAVGSETFTAHLPGGVTINMPLVVEVTNGRTRPTASMRARRPLKPDGFMPTGDDRTTRLADVIVLWNVLQHFYPYRDQLPSDWTAPLQAALSRAAADGSARNFVETLESLLVAAKDGHGGVLGPFGPPGLLPIPLALVDGRVVAIGSAQSVRQGDVLIAADGVMTETAFSEAISQSAASTDGHRAWRALDRLFAGDPGSTVRLSLLREGRPIALDVKRVAPYQRAPEVRPISGAMLEPGYLYIDLTRATEADLQASAASMAEARGIIFDARGRIQAPPALLAPFLERTARSARFGPIVVTHPDGVIDAWLSSGWTVDPASPRAKAKIAFVIDGRAISYAETFLSFVETEKIAALVGEPTAGTNGNINPFELPGGYKATWTGAKVQKADGSPHHGVGVLPTVPASRTLAGLARGEDEQIAAALLALKAR